MRRWVILVLIATTCLLQACFNVRTPELPQSGSTGFTPPTEPSILIDNLTEAFRTINITNYERCFSPAFRFTAEPTVSGNNVGIFTRWTIIEEVEYLKNIAIASSQTGNNTWQFIAPRTQFITADSLEYVSEYSVQLFTADTNLRATSFQGRLIFTMVRRANNDWQIATWQDNKTDNNPCFTDIKQHFISP